MKTELINFRLPQDIASALKRAASADLRSINAEGIYYLRKGLIADGRYVADNVEAEAAKKAIVPAVAVTAASPVLEDPPKAETSHRPLDERYRGKSYKKAVELALELEARPLSLAVITEKLVEAGMRFAAKVPGRSVASAIAGCERDQRVRRSSSGLWELVPKAERPSHAPRMTKRVDPHVLSEKTRLGLSHSKQRGVKHGREEKMTDDQKNLVVEMIAQGKPVTKTASAVGLTWAGLNKWLKRHDIREQLASGNRPEFPLRS